MVFPHPLRRLAGRCFVAAQLLLLWPSLPLQTREEFRIRESSIQEAVEKYGPEAGQRLREWEHFIRGSSQGSERDKLERVNRFFNRFEFVDDAIHWHQKDYWATPLEFLASDGGDCEDFALAKYFTLRELGLSDEKLSLTYVKALRLNQAHMVLTYYASPGAEPLVLDNLVPQILPASQRKDLLPVYSFNGSSLWIAKQRGRGEVVGSTDQLNRWREMMQRMPEELRSKEKKS